MKEEELDEVCEILIEMEKLIKLRDLKEEYFFNRNQTDDKLTVRDFRYQSNKIEEYEKSIREKAKKIAKLLLINQDSLEKVFYEIFSEDYQGEIGNLMIKEIAKHPYVWKGFLEKEFINTINKLKIEPKNLHSWERFIDLSTCMQKDIYNEKSDFYNKLLYEIDSQNSSMVYWATMILWEKNYTNSKTINAFRKNLNHPDWRIRIVSYECLQTWIKEKEIELEIFPKLSIKDFWRRRIHGNYESKLLSP